MDCPSQQDANKGRVFPDTFHICGQHTPSSPWKKIGKGTLVHFLVGAPRVLFSGGVGGHTCGWAEDPLLQKEHEGLFVAFAGGDAHAPAVNQRGDFLQENKPAFGEAVSFCSPKAGRLPIAKGSGVLASLSWLEAHLYHLGCL